MSKRRGKSNSIYTNLNEFTKINEVYASYFGDHRPARSCVEVSRLPRDVAIKLEAIAFLNNNR